MRKKDLAHFASDPFLMYFEKTRGTFLFPGTTLLFLVPAVSRGGRSAFRQMRQCAFHRLGGSVYFPLFALFNRGLQ